MEETFTTNCRTFNQPKPIKFTPPPYCRIINLQSFESDELEQVPSLKLIVSNPAKLLMLMEKLTDESSKLLEIKINTYLMKEAECRSTFIIRLSPASEEAIIQVRGTEDLETPLRLPVAECVMKNLVQYEDILTCSEILHSQILDVFNAIYPASRHVITTVPILDKKFKYYPCSAQNIQPVFLVCFVDSPKNEDFLVKLANEVFRFCQTVLLNTLSGEEEERRAQQSQMLLHVAECMFSNLEDIAELLSTIASEGRHLTGAQQCSIFLVDPDHVRCVANDFKRNSTSVHKVRVHLAQHHEIADYVATTGEIVNLRNSNIGDISFFGKNIQEITEKPTRNLLCFPFRNRDKIVGVAQLCNKEESNFTDFDVELIKVYSVYCGVAVMHSLNHKYVSETERRSGLSNALQIRNVKVTDEEVQKVATCPLIHEFPNSHQFSFCPQIVAERESPCFVLKMFEDLNFMSIFSLKRDVVTRFILMVRKSYKDLPYHNWQHALAVTHFAYLALKVLEVQEHYISDLEALAYFISCLCHGIDHRGINNPFQQVSYNDVASLYSSPGCLAQRHDLSHILCILHTEGCNFLEPLRWRDYSLCLDLIKDITLAADLATHMKFYAKQYKMVKEGYDRENPEHRYIFISLLMTCALLAEQLKEWPVVRQVAQGMFDEFFTLTNLDRKQAAAPVKFEDQNLANIPEMQIEFLKKICLPAFQLLGVIFQVKELIYKIKNNILYWEASKHIFLRNFDAGISNIDALSTIELETNVEAVVKIIEEQ